MHRHGVDSKKQIVREKIFIDFSIVVDRAASIGVRQLL
jgi:hypothetical protein